MAGPPKKRQRREEKAVDDLPRKKFYRQRAHANPFSDHDLTYPESPEAMDWSTYYPAFAVPQATSDLSPNGKANSTTLKTLPGGPQNHLSIPKLSQTVEVADIGCGFGGLLFALAPLFPQTLILGLEIRTSVTAFVQEKIKALRAQVRETDTTTATTPILSDHALEASPPLQAATTTTTCSYDNIACLRANTMKFLPNFFSRGQLRAIFLCFPDPHFKARKHKARIVSSGLAAEYAYVLRPGAKVYTVTDVEDLHLWMAGHFDEYPGFERIGEAELEEDDCVKVMCDATEEGKKVTRNGGKKYVAVFRRLDDPPWP